MTSGEPGKAAFTEQALGKLRAADALLIRGRAFRDPAVAHPLESVDAPRDLRDIESELLLAHLAVIESRLEKLVKQIAAKKADRDVREKRPWSVAGPSWRRRRRCAGAGSDRRRRAAAPRLPVPRL